MTSIWGHLTRCKTLTTQDGEKTQLARVLNLLELVILGVGSTLGLGVYVVAGSVAKTTAGPAVILSFVIAGIVTVLGAMSFAELASRIPTAGSSYVYSYASVGEFVAFTLGWSLIFGSIVGSATLAKGISNYIDSLMGDVNKTFFLEHMPMNVKFLSAYPDFFAFLLVLIVILSSAFGVKSSVRISNILTLVNITVIATVIGAGATQIDFNNWKIPIENVTEEYRESAGAGGFMPFGLHGVIAGTSRCFFAFSGFEIISTTGEEAKNPKRTIPLAIALTLLVVTSVYFGISSVTTLIWPYYLQNADAPFPYVFEQLEMPVIKWIVTIGAIFAMSTCLIGSVFSLPRILYSMGSDGVLFRQLADVNPKTKTPVLAICITGIFSGTVAALFNLEQLIDMVSLIPLINYIIVGSSVLVLRYKNDSSNIMEETKPDRTDDRTYTPWTMVKHIFNLHGIKHPTDLSCRIAKVSLFAFVIMAFGMCISIEWVSNDTIKYFSATVFAIFGIGLWIIIARQPMYSVDHLRIKVPFITIVVCLNMVINMYLMAQLNLQAWINNIIWLSIGYLIYFTYGIHHSTERKLRAIESEPKSPTDAITKF
ncbi:cationic amino acid transporter 2-like [Arctopsyche grandis]|uniref:cationic amino acid transporter 2-like n=1 Tax=Arctopsyche grandis TaxID=121162 RepID=UPI00406D948C